MWGVRVTIPTADDIDAAWLTDRLREAGHETAEVTSFSQTRIGTGQIGACFRYDLRLASSDDSVPGSLIGKFPSDDPTSRATGVQLRNYYREVRFYQLLADELDIPVPRCYYADIVDEGPEHLLLLEDMHPALPGNQLTGCSADVARAVIAQLVGLQAPSWCREDLKQHDWLAANEFSRSAAGELYSQLLPGFIERYGGALAPDEASIIARVAESPDCPLFQPAEYPFCLEHVDYRLDNMLIDEAQSPPQVTVVDWQSVRIGKPMNDVAYFLGAGMLPEERREVEEGIVRDYHKSLNAAGVTDYEWDQCWLDYRKGSFAGFGVTVIASMIVGQTERGDKMFIAMARRHARHALDLGAVEFLGG